MSDLFRTSIEAALVRAASIEELVDILRTHKKSGLTQREAYDALESLRVGASEQFDDRILETLDLVSGFCAPRYRVW